MKRKIAILGTGSFAQSIGKMLVTTNSEVTFGSRDPGANAEKIKK